MDSIRKSSFSGLIGCIFFGIGDWLLGYVDAGIVDKSFMLIRIGHGADYDLTRVTVTLVLGAIGMAFLLPGFRGIAEIVTDEKRKRRLRYTMSLCAVGWLLVHFTVASGIWVYSWLAHQGEAELEIEAATGVTKMMLPTQIVGYVFIYIPLIQLMVYILRKQTVYGRMAALASPVFWMLVLDKAADFLPASHFSTGLFAFCMNGAMMIWFAFCLTKKPAAERVSQR